MKLVEKTYVDPNGYFCTQQVWVKDESAATKMEISAPKAKPAASSDRWSRIAKSASRGGASGVAMAAGR